jgi:hypothetical protein
MNWKGREKKRRWPNLGHHHGIRIEELRKAMEVPVPRSRYELGKPRIRRSVITGQQRLAIYSRVLCLCPGWLYQTSEPPTQKPLQVNVREGGTNCLQTRPSIYVRMRQHCVRFFRFRAGGRNTFKCNGVVSID